MFKECRNMKIKTPHGWENFKGILKNPDAEGLKFSLSNGKTLTVTKDHRLYNGLFVAASSLRVGVELSTVDGTTTIISIDPVYMAETYDIVGTESGTFLVNGVASHNCDEFAFVKPSIQRTFWTSISPTLSTGGACIIASTPNGDNDKFAELWRHAEVQKKENSFEERDFRPLDIKWTDVPGRDDNFKRTEMGKIGELKWNQEYECKFISSDALLIDTNVLQGLNDVVVPPLYVSKKHRIQFWEALKPNKIYLVGVDPSTGTGSDFSVIQIFSFPELKQVGMFRSNTMSSPEMYLILKDILLAIEKVGSRSYFSIENNGVGEGIISMYRADARPPMSADFISEGGKRLGFTTTNRTKLTACILLKDMVEKDSLQIRSPQLLSELKSFVKKGQGYAAQFGSTDDSITSTLVVLRIVENITNYDQSAFEKMFSERSRKAASSLLHNSGDIDEPLPVVM